MRLNDASNWRITFVSRSKFSNGMLHIDLVRESRRPTNRAGLKLHQQLHQKLWMQGQLALLVGNRYRGDHWSDGPANARTSQFGRNFETFPSKYNAFERPYVLEKREFT